MDMRSVGTSSSIKESAKRGLGFFLAQFPYNHTEPSPPSSSFFGCSQAIVENLAPRTGFGGLFDGQIFICIKLKYVKIIIVH